MFFKDTKTLSNKIFLRTCCECGLTHLHRTWYKLWYRGLEGYSRDPGFGQNKVRDSGKRKNSWRDSGLTATREAALAKIRAQDARFFCLSVGISENRHDPRKRSSGKSESSRRAQNINRKGQSTS